MRWGGREGEMWGKVWGKGEEEEVMGVGDGRMGEGV